MYKNCLIGYTGFIGGHLAGQSNFSAFFNSTNVGDVGQQKFDAVVCAAAPGSMFEANMDPERDHARIQALTDDLSSVRTGRFILISTIAVLKDFAGGDDEGATSFQEELAYGRHRHTLENFVEETFEQSLIVRLPALFGKGLRKNFIFDLLNPIPSMLTDAGLESLSAVLGHPLLEQLTRFYGYDKETGMFTLNRGALNADPGRSVLEEAVIAHGLSATRFHSPSSTYQYYNINRLWSDIEVALEAGLSHIHLVSEPLKASCIHRRLTGRDMPENAARQHAEDMRTRHANLWGKQGPYLEKSDVILEQLASFYASERLTL